MSGRRERRSSFTNLGPATTEIFQSQGFYMDDYLVSQCWERSTIITLSMSSVVPRACRISLFVLLLPAALLIPPRHASPFASKRLVHRVLMPTTLSPPPFSLFLLFATTLSPFSKHHGQQLWLVYPPGCYLSLLTIFISILQPTTAHSFSAITAPPSFSHS